MKLWVSPCSRILRGNLTCPQKPGSKGETGLLVVGDPRANVHPSSVWARSGVEAKERASPDRASPALGPGTPPRSARSWSSSLALLPVAPRSLEKSAVALGRGPTRRQRDAVNSCMEAGAGAPLAGSPGREGRLVPEPRRSPAAQRREAAQPSNPAHAPAGRARLWPRPFRRRSRRRGPGPLCGAPGRAPPLSWFPISGDPRWPARPLAFGARRKSPLPAGRFRCRSRWRGPSISVVHHGGLHPRATSSHSAGVPHAPSRSPPPISCTSVTSAPVPLLLCPLPPVLHHSLQPPSLPPHPLPSSSGSPHSPQPPPSLVPSPPATCLSSLEAAGTLWHAFSCTGHSLCLGHLSPAVWLANSHFHLLRAHLLEGTPDH